MTLRKRRTARALAAAILGFCVGITGEAIAAGAFAEARLGEPIRLTGVLPGVLHKSLAGAVGDQQVIIRLRTPTIAAIGGASKAEIEAEQAAFINRVLAIAPTARVIASTQIVLNALFMEVAASDLAKLATDPSVIRVAPVGNYSIDLSDTVPYIGAEAVQTAGIDGSGVRVAVLDSGIDYLHFDLGGSGDPAHFTANNPTVVEAGTFPTNKVVGGFDFVGEAWPGTPGMPAPLAPDPDPLDKGTMSGHGTHVADIIGGRLGVAPGVKLYGVKVCSSVSPSCSGIALIQGMEFAVDPNGDGRTKDRVDIINMSLGADYGQPFDDDLSAAVDNAFALNVLTVAAAGNAADKPYIVGSPSAARTAVSVAQTHVPSAFIQFMEIVGNPNPNRRTVVQAWSAPLMDVIEGAVRYDTTNASTRIGCTDAAGTSPWSPGALAGRIVLVDRGLCAGSMKIHNIAAAGGILGIIGFLQGQAPFSFAFGGGDLSMTIPAYGITFVDANDIRGGATVRFDPDSGIPLVGTMVSTSSRGPQMQDQSIKPDIGAPGASVSAQNGTGTGRTPFGGTSGASPMVAGAAALLLEARDFSARDLKQVLINTADPDILNIAEGPLAAIARIGAGEVRVDDAVAARAKFFVEDGRHHGDDDDDDDKRRASGGGGVSFGFVDVTDRKVKLEKRLSVRNLSKKQISYTIETSMRFADDVANGAVELSAPHSISVGPRDTRSFTLRLEIDGDRLRNNLMNSGAAGNNPGPITLNEYDGYVTLKAKDHKLSLPWHVLPRKDAKVSAEDDELDFRRGSSVDTIKLRNRGVGTAQLASFSLIAFSEDIPEGARGGQSPTPDLRAVGVSTFPVPAGFCSANPSFVWVFLINTWERQSHLVPVSHFVNFDTSGDGVPDFLVLNRDVSLNNVTDGRQLTWSVDLSTGLADAFFFATHPMNSGNTQLTICAEQVGLTGTDLGTRRVNVSVEATDFYFGGPGDLLEGLTITPGGERYVGTAADIAGNASGTLSVTDRGALPGNSPELGVLLQTDEARAGGEGGATQKSEALIIWAEKQKKKHKDRDDDGDDDD